MLVTTGNLGSEHKLRYRDVIGATYIRPRRSFWGWHRICRTIRSSALPPCVPTLLVAHGFSLVRSAYLWSSAMSIATVPGALLAALVSDKWDRRWSITLVALLIGAAGLLYGFTFKAATSSSSDLQWSCCLHTFVHSCTRIRQSATRPTFETLELGSPMGRGGF